MKNLKESILNTSVNESIQIDYNTDDEIKDMFVAGSSATGNVGVIIGGTFDIFNEKEIDDVENKLSDMGINVDLSAHDVRNEMLDDLSEEEIQLWKFVYFIDNKYDHGTASCYPFGESGVYKLKS